MTNQDSIKLRDETFFVEFLSKEAVIQGSDQQHTSSRESVFHAHSLKPDDPALVAKPLSEGFQPPSWIFGVFLLQMIIISIVASAYRNIFQLQLSSTISRSGMEQLVKEGNPLTQVHSLLLLLVYALSAATFTFISLGRFSSLAVTENFRLFLNLLILSLSFPVIKIIFFAFTGRISGERNTNRLYITNLVVYDILAGLFIFPLAFLFTYSAAIEIFYTIILTIALLYMVRGIRGIHLVFKQSTFTGLYIILYLCTLEILPVLLVIIWSLRSTGNMI